MNHDSRWQNQLEPKERQNQNDESDVFVCEVRHLASNYRGLY